MLIWCRTNVFWIPLDHSVLRCHRNRSYSMAVRVQRCKHSHECLLTVGALIDEFYYFQSSMQQKFRYTSRIKRFHLDSAHPLGYQERFLRSASAQDFGYESLNAAIYQHMIIGLLSTVKLNNGDTPTHNLPLPLCCPHNTRMRKPALPESSTGPRAEQ